MAHCPCIFIVLERGLKHRWTVQEAGAQEAGDALFAMYDHVTVKMTLPTAAELKSYSSIDPAAA